MKAEVDNALLIKYSSIDDFFYRWMLIVGRVYGLSNLECKVFSRFLVYLNDLKDTVTDFNTREELCTNNISRNRIAKELNMSRQQFVNILSKLVKKGIIKPVREGGSKIITHYYISPLFIPKYTTGKPTSLAFVFKMMPDEKVN